MKYQFILMFCIFSLLLTGCPSPVQTTVQHHELQEQEVAPSGALPAPMPTNVNNPDWMNETIQATGQGAVNPRHAHNPAQAQLMAKRAAMADARRNLLERVLVLRLDSSTTVRDMVAESDEINAETSGFIRDSYIISENFDGSIATVEMELKLYSVYTYMKTKKIYYE